MAEIVNLRMARKARDRREREGAAAAARARHGEAKAARLGRDTERQREAERLEGHRLDGPEEQG